MTLRNATSYTGVGIHTGVQTALILRPAAPGSGLYFLSQGTRLDAIATNVVDTGRCTVLGNAENTVKIATIEHLLSTIAGFGITDLEIEVSGPEIPIADGSAKIWCELLQSAGVVALGDAPPPQKLTKPLLVTGKDGAFIAAYPSDRLTLTVAMYYDHPMIGTQVCRWEAGKGDYESEIAPARTFGLIEEVEQLQKMGLAKGGSLDNAIVVYPDHYSTPLRFDNELARHKLLDLIGDLRLAGPLPVADFIANKPGHKLNNAMARLLAP